LPPGGDPRTVLAVRDFEAVDFFRDEALVADPYPYFDALRGRCPVWREPHHDVVMVTGYDEAVEVYNDTATFSSCVSVTGPFPGFPVPLEGDDVTELIEAHRDELPMSDQLPTLDPPVHTAHRGLLMRLITPKRLKENEASMWQLADGLLDDFLVGTEGEVIKGFAGPFTMLVIADLLGVPEEDREDFAVALHQAPGAGGGVGSTGGGSLGHSPLEYLYRRFAGYVEDRRREPRDDVLTGLATATFPDGSTPSVDDVVRVAANLFAAGQETTVRLLGSPAAGGARPHRQLRRGEPADREPGQGRLPHGPHADHGGRGRHPRRDHGDGAQRCRRPRPPPLRPAGHVPPRAGQRPPAPGLRPRHPHLPGRPAGPGRGPRRHPAAARPHRRHPGVRGPPRPARRPPLELRADVHPPRGHPAPPGVHAAVKARIDEDLCRGHAVCCSLCPEVFELTDDGYAEVRVDVVPPEHEETVRAAVTRCPERAISAG
jgi:ferredoxin